MENGRQRKTEGRKREINEERGREREIAAKRETEGKRDR